jgi:hypothetical protein
MKYLCATAMLSLMAVQAASPAAAQTRYAFTSVQVPGSVFTATEDFANGADLIGYFFDANYALHAFIDHDGTFTQVDAPGENFGTVLVAANSQVMIGQIDDIHGNTKGFVRAASGKFTKLVEPHGTSTFPMDINEAGTIVGYYFPKGADTVSEKGFIYRNGTFKRYLLPGSEGTEITGINRANTIVGSFTPAGGSGYQGFILAKGVVTYVSYPGAPETHVQGINDKGVVVGYFGASNTGFQGFTYDGTTYSLAEPRGAPHFYGEHITKRGKIVGFGGAGVGYVGTPRPPKS